LSVPVIEAHLGWSTIRLKVKTLVGGGVGADASDPYRNCAAVPAGDGGSQLICPQPRSHYLGSTPGCTGRCSRHLHPRSFGGSVNLKGHLIGIPITVGPAILVGLAVLGVLSRLSGGLLIAWVGLGFVALLIHELGHAVAFRHYGVASSISFWALGGFTAPDDQEAAERLSDRQMLVVTVAGPLVGLVVGAGTLLVGFVARDALRPIRMPIFLWLFVNLGWAVFNLMPVSSLDGGQALEHLAAAALGRPGRAIGLALGLLSSGLIAVIALNLGLLSVAFVAVVFGLFNPTRWRRLRAEIWPPRQPVAGTVRGGDQDAWGD
jgi:Zn-dependent protease